MLALDQRESLRAMFPLGSAGDPVGDEPIREFKRAGIELLTPHASAVLLDRYFVLDYGRPAGLADGCGLIVACDVLHQKTGDPITHVTFDELVTPALLERVRADAIKMLVLWHPTSGRDERAELVNRAIDLAARAGVASLIEGIVRPAPGELWRSAAERHEAILLCAEELNAYGPDIYKAEVPGYVPGDLSAIAENSARMSEIVARDWVVLSNGVTRSEFPDAVAEAVKGGASGFLAGRAVWEDTVAQTNSRAALQEHSIDRLERLREIVDGAAS